MAQTKIVATVGPASESPPIIRGMIEAGADVFRINFSHGTPDEHRRAARLARSLAGEMGREVGLLGDVAGPKLRCGTISLEPVHLAVGQQVALTSENVVGSQSLVPVSYAHLHEDVGVGQEVALDDGRIRLRVEAIEGVRVVCRVVEGGPLVSHKGINLPETDLRLGAITDADRESIALAIAEGFDFLGLSFVSSAAEVEQARAIAKQHHSNIALIAKIERRLSVERLAAILAAADGAMVARGDLGVELPIERVPIVQKLIIRACNECAKPVITATQMLESMIHNPRPTRAEVADIANAILDGTDAVMLSGETAVGKYAIEAVLAMDRVARVADDEVDRKSRRYLATSAGAPDDSNAIAQAAAELADDLQLDAIVCVTAGGSTARRISRHRPRCPVLAVTSNLGTYRQLLLSWGVEPVLLPELALLPVQKDQDRLACTPVGQREIGTWVGQMLNRCVEIGRLVAGQRVAIVAGIPLGTPGTTNLIHVATVG